MPILRVQKHRHNYVIMDKSGLEDSRLSYRARGLLAALLAKPDDWEVNLTHLANDTQVEGREALMSAMHELETYGYARKQLRRGERGKFLGYVTYVYETPTLASTEVGFADVGKPDVGTEVGFAEVGYTEVGKTAPTKNTKIPRIQRNQGNTLSGSPGRPGQPEREISSSFAKGSGKKKAKTPAQKGYSPLFCAFYAAYPRKEDPDEAWKAWQQIDGDALADVIMAGVQAHQQNNEAWKRHERRYIKKPAAWLRAGAYKSELAPALKDEAADRARRLKLYEAIERGEEVDFAGI